MSGLPQNEESSKLQQKCQEMSEAIQDCIDKLKATGAHVNSGGVVANTTSNDITSNSDPQIAALEPSEVCTNITAITKHSRVHVFYNVFPRIFNSQSVV